MEFLSHWGVWHWLILGFILLISEILIPGVFLLWFGCAALILAALTALISLPMAFSWALYAVLALLLSYFWWKVQHKQDKNDKRNADLNQRTLAMIGKSGIVTQFQSTGNGRARFGDTTWKIQGENLSTGDLVTVTNAEGINLIVKKSVKE